MEKVTQVYKSTMEKPFDEAIFRVPPFLSHDTSTFIHFPSFLGQNGQNRAMTRKFFFGQTVRIQNVHLFMQKKYHDTSTFVHDTS